MNKIRNALMFLCLPFFSSCIVTSIDQEYRDPTFSWDTLKRDQILMMPLEDLREKQMIPPNEEHLYKFYTPEQSIAYAEAFKQVFFKTRKDIRVFGAGGAYENISALKDLKQKTSEIMEKKPFSAETLEQVKAGTQDIRFFMAFAVTYEQLSKSFSVSEPPKARYAVKSYAAIRTLTVKMALWDSKENKTVWVATKILTPQNVRTFRVPRRTRPTDDDHVTMPLILDANDNPYDNWDLATELSYHPERFPSFPDREPAFSSSFDDFALALPLHPSEEKYIEYESFTYHRPEMVLHGGKLGRGSQLNLDLQTSSIIHNRYRIGGGISFPLNSAAIHFQNADYTAAMAAIGLTFDAEFSLSETKRLLVGSGIAAGVLTANRREPADKIDDACLDSISDTVGIYTPHLKLQFGNRQGAAWAIGGSYRFLTGVQEDIFSENRLSPWTIDLSLAYTFRGF